MTPEQEAELHILNVSYNAISEMLHEQIKGLTEKALSLKIEEKDRMIVLGGRRELLNFMKGFHERRERLKALKQKESDDGRSEAG